MRVEGRFNDVTFSSHSKIHYYENDVGFVYFIKTMCNTLFRENRDSDLTFITVPTFIDETGFISFFCTGIRQTRSKEFFVNINNQFLHLPRHSSEILLHLRNRVFQFMEVETVRTGRPISYIKGSKVLDETMKLNCVPSLEVLFRET